MTEKPTETPAEKYAERLDKVVDVESVNSIFPAGPDILSLSQGKIFFYSTTAEHHRYKRSELFYKNSSDTVNDVIISLGDLDPEEYSEDYIRDKVKEIIERVGVPSGNMSGYAVIVKDNSGSIVGSVMSKSVGPLSNRFQGMSVTVKSVGSWDSDEFIGFLGELQEEYAQEFY